MSTTAAVCPINGHLDADPTRLRWRFGSGVALIVGLLLAGCSSYRAPTLSVAEATLVERTDQGAVIAFAIDAAHDNNDALPLREARYTLELNGTPVFSGIRSAQCTLGRFGTQRFNIPASIPAASLTGITGSGASYKVSGTLTYVTPGAFAEVLFDTGVSRPSVGFSQQGTIDLNSGSMPGTKLGMAVLAR